MRRGRLPDFMVIGAVKAATTWIGHQLRHHPALWLPTAEPHFFSTEYHRGFDWYRSLFADAPAACIIGEKSADYLAHPDAAERIAKTLPNIPLIIQLRDPVERAYSDYCMLYRRGQVSGDPRKYLDHRLAAGGRFLEGGRYAHHIARLFNHVAPERVKILLYEDIRADPEAVIARVCEHIGVATHIAKEAVSERRNDSKVPMLPLPLRRALRPMRPLLDPMRSNPWLSRLRASLTQPVRYPPLTPDLRLALRDYYREDIRQLETIIGRDMTVWLCNDRVVA
jgi:hypothetical protein